MKKLIFIIPLILVVFGISACYFVSVKENKEHNENNDNSTLYNEYKIILKDDSEPNRETETEREYTEPSKTEPSRETEKKNTCDKNRCGMKNTSNDFEMEFDEFGVEVIVSFDSSVGFTVDKAHGVIKGVPYGTTTYANFSFEADTENAEYFSYKICDENDYVIDRGTVFISNGEKQEICSLLPINRNTTYRVFVFGDE